MSGPPSSTESASEWRLHAACSTAATELADPGHDFPLIRSSDLAVLHHDLAVDDDGVELPPTEYTRLYGSQ